MSDEAAPTPEPGGRSPRFVRRLASAGAVGPVVFWLVVLVLGFARAGYSHVSDPVSDLGAVNAPYAIVQQGNFVLLGISIIAFAVAIDRALRDGWRPWVGVLLIGVFGLLGAIGSGVFPANPGNPETMTNVLHGTSVSVGFLAGIIGISLTAWRLSLVGRWPGYRSRWTVVGTALLMFGSFALFLFLMINETGYGGLGQRLFAGIVSGWIAYHSYQLHGLTSAA